MISTPSGIRTAAIVAAAGFAAVGIFEFALAAGAPLGRAAWGGSSAHISTGLRVGSALAVPLYASLAWFVLARGGLLRRSLPPPALLRRGTLVLAALLTLGTVMNFASRSPWERWIMGPSVLVLAACCWILARAPVPAARR